MRELIGTVIVGGGQAGLALSYYLTQVGQDHIIFERGRVAESWRSERWDSLVFQFPSWSIKLPGYSYHDGQPDGFAPKDAIIKFLEDYSVQIAAPIRCGVRVISLGYDAKSKYFLVDTETGRLRAANVVVATGSYHQPVIPALAALIPRHLFQIHTRDYKNPSQLPPGDVLIVGSGASGVQIAEELNQSGRKVYLSVGRHDKAPRRYRDRDIYWWFEALGIWSRPLELQPELRTFRILITGAAGGHDIDLRGFSSLGITLLGRLKSVIDGKLYFASDVEETLAQAETWFPPYRVRMDAYVDRGESQAFPAHVSELPITPLPPSMKVLDLACSAVRSIIWATGFGYDYGWINLPVFGDGGVPQMQRGVTKIAGLYFLGLRRSYTIRSGLLPGVGDDAAHIAQHIASRN